MSKPAEILELEEILGFKFEETYKVDDILNNRESGTCLLNKNEGVIGLNIAGRRISDISFLQSFPNLIILNLSNNPISDISFLQSLTNLTSLNLNINRISDISPLQSLTNLTTLNLWSNGISNISFLQSLTNLTSLDLGVNQISDISFLQFLTNLMSLNLDGNRISDISFLQSLTNLTELGLGHNQISDISFLQSLTNLTELSLGYNQISDISFLQSLTNLTELSLGYNQISDISFLQSLTNLNVLNLGNNKISDISLSNLSKLQTLGINNNPLKSIKLFNFENIKELDLKYLQIEQIILENLPNLTSLNLWGNKISDISFLQSLTNLNVFNLANNEISDISFLQSLTNLTNLDLGINQISDISLDFLNHFLKLNKLELHNNPIKNIPKEIFNKRENVLKQVRDYLEGISKGSTKNREVKLILVGNGSVGKTQVARRLEEKENFVINKVHNSTHAIEILCSILGDFEVNIWDFAGQDLYHATHRLFMQSRALFVLVWDFDNENCASHTWEDKQYDNEKLQYWLEYAHCFGKESPILVLQNKIDKPNQKDFLKDHKDRWKKEFPIIDFLQVSAENNEGFEALEYILEDIFTNNPAFQQNDLPTDWVHVREVIKQKQKEDIKTISIAEFQVICEEKGCISASNTVLNYLHDTGVFYYQEKYFNSQIILNQSWAIEAIYKILNRENKYISEIVAKLQKGTLLYKNICKIWENNTDDERKLFIDFMLSAELAFETTKDKKDYQPLNERTFAVPSLLPLEKPAEVVFYENEIIQQSTKEKIEYTFLPKVFIQRFIVLASRFSEVQYMWQKGLYVSTQEGNAIVEANYTNRTISIVSNNKVVIQKIKEELKSIANEGNLKGRITQGENKSDTEKYWGLSGLKENKNNINNENMNTETFKKRLSEGVMSAIPDLLEVLKSHENKMNGSQKSTFNTLKYDFVNRTNNFQLEDWKSRVLGFMIDFSFEETKSEIKTSIPDVVQNIGEVNNATLLQLLEEAFDDDGIQEFCFMYFDEVSNNFAGVMPKKQKIMALITYCRHHNKVNELLVNIKKERPAKYKEYFG